MGNPKISLGRPGRSVKRESWRRTREFVGSGQGGLQGPATARVGQPRSLGRSQAPLGVTCVSPSGCPWTPGAEGREGGACGVGTRKSPWSLSKGLWGGGKEAGC